MCYFVIYGEQYLDWSGKLLSHLPLEKMDAISQILFSDAFSWIKILYFD